MATQGIVEILNANGYKNTDTRRQRAVKNLNLLIDAGVLSFKFINAEAYNDRENGKSFWFEAQNGKKYCTAYKVTLYGKTYYGHFMQKKSVQKYVRAEYFDGRKEWDTITNYYDNFTISVSEIQSTVARLLSIINGDGDFMKSNGIFELKGECSCGKCNGLGIIPAFAYYAEGICFDCGGSGVDRKVLQAFINKQFN